MSRVRIDASSRMPLEALLPSRAVIAANQNAPSPYVPLSVRSHFSFLRGASSPERLVERAATIGYDAIALTDLDGLYGMVRAHDSAKKCGIRIIVGCELTLDEGLGPYGSVTVHVENHAGYTNLCRILTESHRLHPKGARKTRPTPQPSSKERGSSNLYAGVPASYVAAHAEGLWAMVFEPLPDDALTSLQAAFASRLSMGIYWHADGRDRSRLAAAKQIASRYQLPLCATGRVFFAERKDKPVLDTLHCIREGKTLDDAGRQLLPNAEAHLKAPERETQSFARYPQAIQRSREIADACRFSMSELRYQFPGQVEARIRPDETANEVLRRLTYEGTRIRFEQGLPSRVQTQIEKELRIIADLDVAPYFLSVREIVEMARSRDILCQGRGSAANSAVCYCLGITAVDPSRSNLLFERFLSLERREPPDIDVDFEHERREEVIQAIYEKYGRERAAMVCEVICYRGKSALREVGKVFGLSLEQIERLSELVTFRDGPQDVEDKRLIDAGFDPSDSRLRQVIAIGAAIQGCPRHLSIHVGGFVLSDEALVHVAPIEPATMPNRTIIPWDKDDLDSLGFFKIDVLGLGMLTAIRKAMELSPEVRVSAKNAIERLARIPAEDPRVYESLCRADTVGVFQIESRAQMSMLPRLQPKQFYDLVIEVAIVRPGPIQGGMVHPYLRRRQGLEPPTLPHECLRPILERTLGVPLFQEQVMQIAIEGAGYSGGEADQLRRDMAAWKKSGRLERHREKLFNGFSKRGISADFSERLFKQIQGFGEYGFPESHAASFALLVYASTWLKVHHPAEFAAALLNSQPMGFYTPSTILQDAERHGVRVLPVCVNRSEWNCTIDRSDGSAAIRVGLRYIKGMRADVGARIVATRVNQVYDSVADAENRASLDKRALELLAEAGAFRAFGIDVREALWSARAPKAEGLFKGHAHHEARPSLPKLSRAEQLVFDYRRTGISTTDHPMLLMRPRLPADVIHSKTIATVPHGARASVAGLVICRQRPMTASGVVFITMEDEFGFTNLVLWAKVFEQLRYAATHSSLLLAQGRIEREKDGGVIYLIVDVLKPLAEGTLPSMSRDFH